MEDYSVG